MQRHIRTRPFFTTLVLSAFVFWVAGQAAGQAPSNLRLSEEDYTIDIASTTYRSGAVSVEFEATERLPGASGEAKVDRHIGQTEIEIELDEMKPAWDFGGELNTYVLWAVTPEGFVDNLGEFILWGNRSRLNVSTTLETFGLIVTAEPHFITDKPSPFVVLRGIPPNDQDIARESIRFELDMPYRYERDDLAGSEEVKGVVTSALRQSEIAVQLAKRAGAERLTPELLAEAENQLRSARATSESVGDYGAADVEHIAYRTVRLAVRAEKAARELYRIETESAALQTAALN